MKRQPVQLEEMPVFIHPIKRCVIKAFGLATNQHYFGAARESLLRGKSDGSRESFREVIIAQGCTATSKWAKPTALAGKKTPENRFPKKAKSKVGSHCFSLSFQKATSFISKPAELTLPILKCHNSLETQVILGRFVVTFVSSLERQENELFSS